MSAMATIVFTVLFVSFAYCNDETPIVFMHGINSNASIWDGFVDHMRQKLPGVYIANVEIGNGRNDSIAFNLNKYIELFAETVASDPKLANGFDLIAHSQGGIVTRAYIEYYNTPKVRNFVTMATPHAGFFCPSEECVIDMGVMHDPLLAKLSDLFYSQYGQEEIMPAGYWRDPGKLRNYYRWCEVLPYINNEKEGVPVNNDFKQNLMSLEGFLMIGSPNDGLISPWESSFFEFYDGKSETEVVPLRKSPLYKEDRIGLKELDMSKKLKFHTCGLNHTEYSTTYSIFDEAILPFIRQ